MEKKGFVAAVTDESDSTSSPSPFFLISRPWRLSGACPFRQMAIILNFPFQLTKLTINVFERITIGMARSPITNFCAGVALGWFAHVRYGDNLLGGVSTDITRLWLELDSDGDGNVTFAEFEAGMKKRLGTFCPPSSMLKKTYNSVTAAVKSLDTDGDGKISREELEAAIRKATSFF